MTPWLSRLSFSQWCLRFLGVALTAEGVWFNDRHGSTHFRAWPWRARKGGM